MHVPAAPILRLALALLFAAPALAQDAVDPQPAPAVQALDADVVGFWMLDEVVEIGYLGQMGVEIDAMTCQFRADGTADVAIAVTQDQETASSSRTFAYTTAEGEIRSEGDDPMRYRMLDDGRMELADDTGLVLLFERAE